MRAPPLGVLGAGAIALAALTLAIVGAPHDRPAPAPTPRASLPPASVTGGGITLSSASIELPDDAQSFPAGTHAALVTARCTACHSAGMVLTQPPLTADQWKAEVAKMRETYKAPVAEAEAAAIVDYLVAMPAQRH